MIFPMPNLFAANSSLQTINQVLNINTINLDTTLYLPNKIPAPAILLAHGIGGNKDSVIAEAKYFAQNGFVVLTWSAQGFGKSTGSISMDSIDKEIADEKGLLDFLAKQSQVQKDNSGNPIIGAAGASYGGASSLMIAAVDSRIKAVAADITWNNLQNVLFPQNALGLNYPGPFKKTWAGTIFNLIAIQNSYLGQCGNFQAEWCNAFNAATSNQLPDEKTLKLLAKSSPGELASKIKVPTLLMQGEDDSLFPLAESVKTASQIKLADPKTPVSLIWHTGGHDGGLDETPRLQQLTLRWMKKYLLGNTDNFPTFQITDATGGISVTDSTVISRILQSNKLPISQKLNSLPLNANLAPLFAPTGGIPSAISSLPGVGNAGGLASSLTSFNAPATGSPINPLGQNAITPFLLPGQSTVFTTSPQKLALKIIGSPQIKIHLTSTKKDAVLFFSTVRISSNGITYQPSGIVAPIRVDNIPNDGIDITVKLPATYLKINPGDKVGVAVSATDQGYALPVDGRLYTITPISPLLYPTLDVAIVNNNGQNISWLVAAVIFLIIGGFYVGYLRFKSHTKLSNNFEDSDSTLLRISNLSKTYPDGYAAVSGLSFEIKAGQVVGLLGPNGAGKTTTLRMVLGLIYPTAGEIWIKGQKVYPGSAALSQIGALVEGPGFLPHLSGRENLNLYWKSIGRIQDPRIEEILEITRLGTAVDKKVRSYSQGMRQRLAIAQAMLGMPPVLILDEPTNGLDPQQIAEMRQVLSEYAKDGRTVIVSSHILAEIQQTCSDVILMHRGQLLVTGELNHVIADAMSLEEVFLKVIGNDLIIGKEKL